MIASNRKTLHKLMCSWGSGGQDRVGMLISSRSGSRVSSPLTARAADVAHRIISRRPRLREACRSNGSLTRECIGIDASTSAALIESRTQSKEPLPAGFISTKKRSTSHAQQRQVNLSKMHSYHHEYF